MSRQDLADDEELREAVYEHADAARNASTLHDAVRHAVEATKVERERIDGGIGDAAHSVAVHHVVGNDEAMGMMELDDVFAHLMMFAVDYPGFRSTGAIDQELIDDVTMDGGSIVNQAYYALQRLYERAILDEIGEPTEVSGNALSRLIDVANEAARAADNEYGTDYRTQVHRAVDDL